jgi:hypothetical protein
LLTEFATQHFRLPGRTKRHREDQQQLSQNVLRAYEGQNEPNQWGDENQVV